MTEINRRTANAFLAGYSWGIVFTALYFLFANNIILQVMLAITMIGAPIMFVEQEVRKSEA